MQSMNNGLCGDEDISGLVQLLGSDEAAGQKRLDALLAAYSGDARLYFLKGSFLAGNRDYGAAATAMRRAVDLAPGYDLARFQLGFLLLTSGEPYAAQEAWGPLHGLPSDAYVRRFVEGLCHLIRDEFEDAVSALEDGIARNADNAPMNADMHLIIESIHTRDAGDNPPAVDGRDEPMSPAQMLLQQAAFKATRH